MLRYYPVSLRLKEKPVLVVGAGRIAQRKIAVLLSCGASVRVVAPAATAKLLLLARNGKISYAKRRYRSSDSRNKVLIIAATSSGPLNDRIAKDALKQNVWVNVVDRTKACSFITPAVIRRKEFVVAVSTDAKKPWASKALKGFLEEKIDEFYSSRN